MAKNTVTWPAPNCQGGQVQQRAGVYTTHSACGGKGTIQVDEESQDNGVAKWRGL